ncbi:EF-Hand 1, calcium-binding site [Sesbania bispinosa]|nr:EF-Hand 1, calcium-binding site [Sesbania bispinosa]
MVHQVAYPSQSDSNSTSPLFGLIDLFLYCTFFNKILKFFSSFRFLFFLRCQFQSDNSDIWEEEEVSEYNSQSEELDEKYDSKGFSELFEDQEPSFEEVKQAFDVSDENKDGFIDPREL